MKKIFFFTTLLIVPLTFGYARNTIAQQNVTPPLLIQQNTIPAVPSPEPGVPPPTGPAGIPGHPLPCPTGIPVVQTIPAQTLLANLPQAVVTTEKLNRLLAPGKIWFMRTPAGESEIKGGLLYQGVVVTVLHFNPLDGSVLPLGINPHEYRSNVQIQSIKSSLSSVIGKLTVLPAAEFIEPEACWSFPVAMDSKIVARLKVYYDGIHVIQNYAANQEMIFYGQ
ncbi:MAG: hypothetical protein DRH24_12630 [Deltaproteobacteria bacterium]|nr:MAG: hypothetical protein DRH24_12630 [Deltaproteobacteria bacterium]